MITKAEQTIQQMKEILFDNYGPEINVFFDDEQTRMSYWDAVQGKPKQVSQEDDDDWFEDEDDIDELVKKGIVDTSFIQFLSGQQDGSDKESVVSWGTGNSAYTEMVDNQPSTSGKLSEITQETTNTEVEILNQRKDLVKDILIKQGVQSEEIDAIEANQAPYELAFSGIHLSSWDPTKEAFIIMAIWSSIKHKPPNNKDE